MKFSHLTDIEKIEGEDYFSSFIWTPNLFVENGRDSSIMPATRDSTHVKIWRSGDVEYHYRVKTLVLCDMDLKRFPHDTQNCTMKIESCKTGYHLSNCQKYFSGSEPSSEITLEWDSLSPIGHNDFSQPEYRVLSINPRHQITKYGLDQQHWSFISPRKLCMIRILNFKNRLTIFLCSRRLQHTHGRLHSPKRNR